MRMLFEDGQLTAEGKRAGAKAGDAAGKSMSQRIKSSLGPAIATGIGTVLGAGFAIAAKGAAELDAATRQFQADTGATAEEATKASHAIAGMYRDNLQGFDQISAALSKVHTDLGLTGTEAEKVTASFLKFGTATGQDAADAVASFDDVLDAWGLTAAETPRIMDLLIASHQKYGGSIAENEKALGTLAPAMQALGMNVDDTVGLLNLFAVSGVDASKATAALNKAVKGLKPGETLDDLIKQISSIEDPTLRAQKAIEIFGAKGGVQLANALKPGVNSLQDFVPAADEVAGATERASDAIESSFGNQFKLILKNAGGALAEFGNNFGPLLLVAAQFGPKMITAIGGGLGAIAGKLFPGLIARLIPAAAIAGTTTGAAMGTSAAIAEVATQTTGVVTGQAAVATAATPAAAAGGTLIGRAMGAAASAALLLAIPLAIAAAIALIGDQFNRGVMEELDKETADAIAGGSIDVLKARREELLKIQRGQRAAHLSGPMVDAINRQIAEIEAAILDPLAATLGKFGGRSLEDRSGPNPVTKGLDILHEDLVKAIDTIKATDDPKAMADALAAVLKSILGGEGNANQTKAIVAELTAKRDAALARGDTATATLFTNAIARLEPFAKGRQWQAEQIAEARKVVASNQTTAEKVAALKGIQADLLSHQRTMAAGIVGGLLKVEKAVNKVRIPSPTIISQIIGGGSSTPPKAPPKAPVPNSSGSPDERAAGGPVTAGRPYLVGEKGPELFTPRTSGRVIANLAVRSAIGLLKGSKTGRRGVVGRKMVRLKNGQYAFAAHDGPFPGTQFLSPDGDLWASKLDYMHATQGGYASGVAARASGGPVTAGNTYLVGEKGPEQFNADLPTTQFLAPDGTRWPSKAAYMKYRQTGKAPGEMFGPPRPLFVPRATSPRMGMTSHSGSGSGSSAINVNVQGLIKARDPFEIATQLKRVREFVTLTPRREPT